MDKFVELAMYISTDNNAISIWKIEILDFFYHCYLFLFHFISLSHSAF